MDKDARGARIAGAWREDGRRRRRVRRAEQNREEEEKRRLTGGPGEEKFILSFFSWAVTVVPLNIFPDSSHLDGSIYKGTSGWKRDFCVVDRRESK